MKTHFERLARYNRWANQQLYDAAAQLSAEEFHAPRSGFFPSIAKTLNHIMVGDRTWMGRFTGAPSPHKQLDEMPYPDFAELRAARAIEDQRIVDFMSSLTAEQIDAVFHYRNMAGDPKSAPLNITLTHFFNHQTHHRGQAHAMLSSTRVAPPGLDLIYFVAVDKA
jgi:uncharacterized damage-inducible protein DinB